MFTRMGSAAAGSRCALLAADLPPHLHQLCSRLTRDWHLLVADFAKAIRGDMVRSVVTGARRRSIRGGGTSMHSRISSADGGVRAVRLVVCSAPPNMRRAERRCGWRPGSLAMRRPSGKIKPVISEYSAFFQVPERPWDQSSPI